MAFPTITGTNGGGTIVNATSSTINLPASIAAGDLLIATVTVDNNTGSPFTGWPAGWTQLYAQDHTTQLRVECRYKLADGAEGASFVLGHANNMSSHHTLKIAAGTWDIWLPPVAGSAVTGSGTTTPDAPSLNPTLWDVADTLWLVVLGYDDGSTSHAGTGADYTLVGSAQRGNNGQSTGTIVVSRNLAAASLDPAAGAITLSANEVHIVNTVAIAPIIRVRQLVTRAPNFLAEWDLVGAEGGTIANLYVTNTSGYVLQVFVDDGVKSDFFLIAAEAGEQAFEIDGMANPDDPAFTMRYEYMPVA